MNEVYVVTGASGGIGRSVVEAILAQRPNAVCAAIDLSADQLGDIDDERLFRFGCDLSDPVSVEATIEAVCTSTGLNITALVNCAGTHAVAASMDLAPADWDRVLGANLNGTFYTCQSVGRRMASSGGGAIVNLSSVTMYYGTPGRIAYGVSKAGVGAVTRTLAVEWAPLNIRVNAIAPGYIETNMVKQAVANGAYDLDAVKALHPVGRLGLPSEVADAALFLLSPEARFITGEILNVDGGFMAKRV